MSKRSIRFYLPEPATKAPTQIDPHATALVQARIPVALYEELREVKQDKGWTLSDMVRAGLFKLASDERNAKKRHRLERFEQISMHMDRKRA